MLRPRRRGLRPKATLTQEWGVLTTQPYAEQDQEGGVIAGPLVLGLFPVVEVTVDPLRRGEQVEHLPGSKLEIHLPEAEQTPQVLVALSASRVARCVPAAIVLV